MTNPLDNPPEGEPVAPLVAGDTWTWRRSDLVAAYPLVAYALAYAMKRDGDADAAPVTFAAAETGNTYQVTVPAATTADFTPGTWVWSAFMTRTSDSARVQVATGSFTVVADGTISTADPRSHAQRMLDAIEALLENRATSDVNSYSIAGRSLTKMSVTELRQLRNYYRREVSGANVSRIKVARFLN
ncbi:hypothetical protein [Aestuariivirga litoralis]|uniref:hypothetical protein n=1 Tax=Aestuariivirga litoralis TaxID=2650924 RepID=UPI0018C57514|nr:hypothetical protein [Aestuariivirga litoralis]MBG1232981.1 hypothetical protein [Aestuariivirga litoralis]